MSDVLLLADHASGESVGADRLPGSVSGDAGHETTSKRRHSCGRG